MAAVILGSKAVGSVVKLNVGGTARNFIVVHQGKPGSMYDESCDGTWLLMKDCYEKKRWHSSDVNDYGNSEIHKYLNGDFLKLFDANIQVQIKRVKLPYRKGSGYGKTVTSGASGLSATIFPLSSTEVNLVHGYEPTNEGACLSYFTGTAQNGADNKRVANFSGSAADWWLRSPVCSSSGATSALYVARDGIWSSRSCSSAGCAIRPALILPSSLSVSDDGTVNTNTAPTTPASITIPSSIQGGTSIQISWAASTDAENNLEGYVAERSVDGGGAWTRIYQGDATRTTNTVPFGTESVMYRVQAYDSEGLESGWRTSGQVVVVNNRAPGAPPSITVPVAVNGGASLVVSWGAASDSDGNLSGYELERQVDGKSWERIYRGDKLTFTDSITKGWNTVAYRVRAYDDLDAAGAYTTSQTRTVNNNTAPVVTCDTPDGTDLGTKAEGFTVDYSVSDVDADAVTVTEAIDGAAKRGFQAELGQNYTFDVTGGAFMRVLNGKHTLSITATDGQATTTHTLAFTKEVTAASITLKTPMDADAEITLAVLSVTGNIPADAEYTVEVTNNGKDDVPVWQDVTAAVKTGANIVFENHTAINGFAFNFRVAVKRGPSGKGGYITSVQGGFQ